MAAPPLHFAVVIDAPAPRVWSALTRLDLVSRWMGDPHIPVEIATEATHLELLITGFPTEAIFKHLEFYWRGTVGILKSFIENTEGPQ